jgi:hypothetical protein
MFEVKLDTREMEGLTRDFKQNASPSGMRRMLIRVGVVMLGMLASVFPAWGANLIGGHRWKPLSPVTLKIRAQKAGLSKKKAASMTGEPLQDTGVLRASVSGGTPISGPTGALRRISAQEVALGSNLDYAAKQQEGFGPGEEIVPEHQVKGHYRKARGGKRVRVKAHRVRSHTKKTKQVDGRPFCGWTEDGCNRALAASGAEIMRT